MQSVTHTRAARSGKLENFIFVRCSVVLVVAESGLREQKAPRWLVLCCVPPLLFSFLSFSRSPSLSL